MWFKHCKFFFLHGIFHLKQIHNISQTCVQRTPLGPPKVVIFHRWLLTQFRLHLHCFIPTKHHDFPAISRRFPKFLWKSFSAASRQLCKGTKNNSRYHLEFRELKFKCSVLVPENEKKEKTEILDLNEKFEKRKKV